MNMMIALQQQIVDVWALVKSGAPVDASDKLERRRGGRASSYPLPPPFREHGCTVGIDQDPPV